MSPKLKDHIEQKDKEIVRALKYRIKDRARKELSGLEFKIYEAIWSRCGEDRLYTWVLTSTIAEDIGGEIVTVRKYLKRIENKLFVFRQYVRKFQYKKDDKVKTINNCRLIILILNPERFTEAIKSKTRNKILDLQKKRQNGEISQDELVGSLLDLKYLDL